MNMRWRAIPAAGGRTLTNDAAYSSDEDTGRTNHRTWDTTSHVHAMPAAFSLTHNSHARITDWRIA
jgi:hypothetical protein